jgi:hypothetical protein
MAVRQRASRTGAQRLHAAWLTADVRYGEHEHVADLRLGDIEYQIPGRLTGYAFTSHSRAPPQSITRFISWK